QRFALRGVLRQMVTWTPLQEPAEGYSILIGCNSPLSRMLEANLKMLANQKLSSLDRIFVVFDTPAEQIGLGLEQQMRERFPHLPLSFIYYSRIQARVLATIGWGWAYSWLSWCKGIAATRTRYAFLQDFDAFLLRPDIIEERYHAIRQRNDQYL